MIMISTGTDFDEFVTRLKDKFGFKRKVRCKIRDEDGDGMISLSDQEDLDMAISSSKKAARRDRADVGKLEVRREKDYSYNKSPTLNGASFCPSVRSCASVFFSLFTFSGVFPALLPSRKTSCCRIRKFEFHPLTKRSCHRFGSQKHPRRSTGAIFFRLFFFFCPTSGDFASLLSFITLIHSGQS